MIQVHKRERSITRVLTTSLSKNLSHHTIGVGRRPQAAYPHHGRSKLHVEMLSHQPGGVQRATEATFGIFGSTDAIMQSFFWKKLRDLGRRWHSLHSMF